MGYPHFDEMEPRNEHERRGWATNRMRAYRGSFRHFLRALAAGTAEDEGFEVRLSSWPRTDFSRTDLRALPRVPLDSLVHPAATSYEYAMEMQGAPYLLVRYLRAPEDPAYQRFKGAHLQRYGDQRSYLELRNSLLFNARGYLNNPLDVYTYGYWFWERIAELLPIEYEPATDAEQ